MPGLRQSCRFCADIRFNFSWIDTDELLSNSDMIAFPHLQEFNPPRHLRRQLEVERRLDAAHAFELMDNILPRDRGHGDHWRGFPPHVPYFGLSRGGFAILVQAPADKTGKGEDRDQCNDEALHGDVLEIR